MGFLAQKESSEFLENTTACNSEIKHESMTAEIEGKHRSDTFRAHYLKYKEVATRNDERPDGILNAERF